MSRCQQKDLIRSSDWKVDYTRGRNKWIIICTTVCIKRGIASVVVVVHKLTDALLTLFVLLLINWYFWLRCSCWNNCRLVNKKKIIIMNHKSKATEGRGKKKKIHTQIQTMACLKRRCEARINEIYIPQCGQKQNAPVKMAWGTETRHKKKVWEWKWEQILREKKKKTHVQKKIRSFELVITFLSWDVKVINCDQHQSWRREGEKEATSSSLYNLATPLLRSSERGKSFQPISRS